MYLVDRLSTISFESGNVFSWDPIHGKITYDKRRLGSAEGQQQLLHEFAHALLDHSLRRTTKPASEMEWEADRLAQVLGGLL